MSYCGPKDGDDTHVTGCNPDYDTNTDYDTRSDYDSNPDYDTSKVGD